MYKCTTTAAAASAFVSFLLIFLFPFLFPQFKLLINLTVKNISRRHRSARPGRKVYCYFCNIYNKSKATTAGARRCPCMHVQPLLRQLLLLSQFKVHNCTTTAATASAFVLFSSFFHLPLSHNSKCRLQPALRHCTHWTLKRTTANIKNF